MARYYVVQGPKRIVIVVLYVPCAALSPTRRSSSILLLHYQNALRAWSRLQWYLSLTHSLHIISPSNFSTFQLLILPLERDHIPSRTFAAPSQASHLRRGLLHQPAAGALQVLNLLCGRRSLDAPNQPPMSPLPSRLELKRRHCWPLEVVASRWAESASLCSWLSTSLDPATRQVQYSSSISSSPSPSPSPLATRHQASLVHRRKLRKRWTLRATQQPGTSSRVGWGRSR